MIKKILHVPVAAMLLIASFEMAFANDEHSVSVGQTYEFGEADMLDAINDHLVNNKDKIAQKVNIEQEKMKEKAKNFKPDGMLTLSPADRNNTFSPDMTYTLDQDIADAEGRVIYPQGFSFNPLKYQKLSYGMVVIDGSNKDEVEWFKKSGYANTIAYRVLLSDGNYYDVSKELNQQVYYCLPQITKRFQLNHTPSIVTQKGDAMEVKEICIKNCKEDAPK